MAKRLFLLLIICFIEVILTPSFLMADNFLTKSPGYTAVLTVPPEIVKNETFVKKPSNVAKNTSVAMTSRVATLVVQAAPAKASYTVSYHIGTVEEFNAVANNLSYSGLYKFKKMIYGHNSSNLLKNLANRYVGEVITITDGGIARDYIVTSVQKYRKTSDMGLDGDPTLMSRIATSALGNDIALFTCAGTLYRNGDASHRLVIFANAI